jgi:hypothetical protein
MDGKYSFFQLLNKSRVEDVEADRNTARSLIKLNATVTSQLPAGTA